MVASALTQALTSYSVGNIVGTVSGFQPSKPAAFYSSNGAFTGWYKVVSSGLDDLVPGVLVNNNAGDAEVLPGVTSLQPASSLWAHVGTTSAGAQALVLRFAPSNGRVTSTHHL